MSRRLKAFSGNTFKEMVKIMYEILSKERLSEYISLIKIYAPYTAQKAQPGQFAILQATSGGERMPFYLSDYDSKEGTITVVYKTCGCSSEILDNLNEGDCLESVAGPLGMPSMLDGLNSVCLIGEGFHCAALIPKAKKLHSSGCSIDIICGFSDVNEVILEEELEKYSDKLFICMQKPDCSSVSNQLKQLLSEKKHYDMVFVCGSIPIMKEICRITEEAGVETTVSMNGVMFDGTGICGGCRITVDGQLKFACIDGPEFDGHKVNFEEAQNRLNYNTGLKSGEYNRHKCRLSLQNGQN